MHVFVKYIFLIVVWLTIIIQMKTVHKLYNFCERKDMWVYSNDYYLQLIVSLFKSNTITNFLTFLSLVIATCSTILLSIFTARGYIADAWIFHRKLTFTLYEFK